MYTTHYKVVLYEFLSFWFSDINERANNNMCYCNSSKMFYATQMRKPFPELNNYILALKQIWIIHLKWLLSWYKYLDLRIPTVYWVIAPLWCYVKTSTPHILLPSIAPIVKLQNYYLLPIFTITLRTKNGNAGNNLTVLLLAITQF